MNKAKSGPAISATPSFVPSSQQPSQKAPQFLASRSAQVQTTLESLLADIASRRRRNKLETLYPDEGPLRRELYPKHLTFFAGGGRAMERCFMAANRVGKTFGVGGYETALHLTGLYPHWWEGRRFTQPITALVAGATVETTRDIGQSALIGPTS